MNFFGLLFKRSKWFYFLLVCISLTNGLLHITILYFLNEFVSQRPINGFFAGYDYLFYAGIILFSLVLNRAFQTYMINITRNVSFDFETTILKKIKTAKYESFVELGKERVFTAINDARSLGTIPSFIMGVINSLIVLCGSFVYLSWTSFEGTMMLLGAMVVLMIIYLIRNTRIEKELNILRDLQDRYYQYLNDLLYGFKEVKVDRSRNENIFSDYIIKNRDEGKTISINTSIKYMNNELIGSYSWYVIMGLILFVLPKALNVGPADLSIFVITILFMMGPIATLISIFPTYTVLKIAIDRLKKFNTLLDNKLVEEEEASDRLAVTFESLEMRAVTFKYRSDSNDNPFQFGPVDFGIQQGQVVFIVGGNGSGKSTFANLLIGLYDAHEGEIRLNDQVLTHGEIMKDYVSVIFSDIHLFSENYDGFVLEEIRPRLEYLIKLMRLEEVVTIRDEKTFIEPNLSKGQKKRVALIYAILENKPILVIDEWAAEQDPEFRRYFYEVLVNELRNEGKTIIAVTHDDKYFHLADRVIKFDYGNIVPYDDVLTPVPINH